MIKIKGTITGKRLGQYLFKSLKKLNDEFVEVPNWAYIEFESYKLCASEKKAFMEYSSLYKLLSKLSNHLEIWKVQAQANAFILSAKIKGIRIIEGMKTLSGGDTLAQKLLNDKAFIINSLAELKEIKALQDDVKGLNLVTTNALNRVLAYNKLLSMYESEYKINLKALTKPLDYSRHHISVFNKELKALCLELPDDKKRILKKYYKPQTMARFNENSEAVNKAKAMVKSRLDLTDIEVHRGILEKLRESLK